MRLLVALLAPVALAGCAAPTAQLVTPEKEYVEASLNKVRNSLKDPDSAKFYGVYASQGQGEPNPRICGAVNAKNSYGGFTGKTAFTATPDAAILPGDLTGRASLDAAMIMSGCALAPGQPAPPSLDIEYR